MGKAALKSAKRSTPPTLTPAESPWRFITRIAFGLLLVLVVVRATISESVNTDFQGVGAVAAPATPGPATGLLLDLLFCLPAMLVLLTWFGLQVLDVYRRRVGSRSVLVQHFAHRFISEFERPLVPYDSTVRALQSRVRRRRRGRFDILLAPGAGRRYPNLTDHKRNVEYDVARVIDVLGEDAFVSGELSMNGDWVVVPFQPRTTPKQPKFT